MKWLFAPTIALLMHQRNNVKFTLAGVFFCIPLLIALSGGLPEFDSVRGIALILSFAFAWYYVAAMYLTSDESWNTVNGVAVRLARHDLRTNVATAEVAAMRCRLGAGQFGRLYDALADTHANLRDL
ncbi:MAG: hypothetical protein H7Y14_04800, partial [Burkholderiales bacterium]|nr:hypothetical protein [Burkholderiales bacterium]